MKILTEPVLLERKDDDEGNYYLVTVNFEDYDNPHHKPEKETILSHSQIVEWGEKLDKFSRPAWWYLKFQK